MARIQAGEYNTAQLNNIEKISGDYFLKVLQADSSGNFLTPFVPDNYDSIELTYVSSGNGIGEVETVTYKLSSTTVATLTLSYDAQNRLSGVSKS